MRLAIFAVLSLVLAPMMGMGLARADEPMLISRSILFGNPQRSAVRISPDGKQLAWLAPKDGVMNVWVAPVGQLDAARAVTNDTARGIRTYFWAYNNRHLIYAQDAGGNENFNLQAVDLTTGEERNLTPNPAVAARVQQMSIDRPNEILAGINDRTPTFHDLHRIDLTTGQSELVWQHPGTIDDNMVAGVVTDDTFAVRFAIVFTQDGGQAVYQPEGDGWKRYLALSLEDTLTTGVEGFDKSVQVVYMTDSRGRDTGALVAMNVKTQQAAVLAADDKADVGTVLLHPTEKTPQAVSFEYDRARWEVLDPALKPDFDRLQAMHPTAALLISSRTTDDQLWSIAFVQDAGPVRYYLYDRRTKDATFLFNNRDDLADLPLRPMHTPIIKSRDGLNLVSYLTLPASVDPDNTGRATQPVPMVLLVHGGPWARDSAGYNPVHQWLANRGYAVLSVNFRGSTGFGKSFINAANMEWAGKMHDDLIDAVNWAVEQGIAQKDKVAIMGGSYGGYATLVGLTFTPDFFAAGVDIVGPSNIVSLLQTIPPYWAPAAMLWKHRVGDHTTSEGREFLESRSPLFHVEKITKPLLIGQGANDPRVKQSESDQIVSAMQEKKLPVTYVLYPDEGHGFARPQNRLSFFAVTEIFLAEHLGGRVQPIGEDLKSSSIQVPAGADQIPGLPEALDLVR